MDRPCLPLASQAKLPPEADILFRAARRGLRPLGSNPPACALRTEYSVKLIHCQPTERVILVHDKNQPWRRAFRVVVRARCKADFQWLVAKLLLEGASRRQPLAVAHQANIRLFGHETSECLGSIDQVRVKSYLPMLGLPEGRGPAPRKIFQWRTVNPDGSDNPLS